MVTDKQLLEMTRRNMVNFALEELKAVDRGSPDAYHRFSIGHKRNLRKIGLVKPVRLGFHWHPVLTTLCHSLIRQVQGS